MIAAFWLLLRVPGSAQVPQYFFPLPTSFPFKLVSELVSVTAPKVVVVLVVLVPVPGAHLSESVSHRTKADNTSAY